MKTLIATLALVAFAATAYAVPVLQVGAPGVGGVDIYANYSDFTSPAVPVEDDTAVTTGNLIYVGGAYKQDNNTTYLNLGGKYTGGEDWGEVDSDFSLFNGHGAVLFATVPVTSGGALKISFDNAVFFSRFANGTANIFPNNHDPVNDSGVEYLYFDIGNFQKNKENVPNFDEEENVADPDPGAKMGEIKKIYLDVTGYSWIHFDVMALLTDVNKKTEIFTNDYNNPGSHDVTWKPEDGGTVPQEPIPEPGTIVLLGTGLIGLALYGRRRMK